MFSAAGKVLSYLFGETQSTDDLHTDDVHTDDPCEPTVSTEQALERREFEGAVSHVFSGHGLIDSEVYFSLDQVVGGMRPAVGDSVHVSAVRQNAGGGWHAEKVSITTEWEENDDGGIQGSVPTELVGMVTSTSKQTGYVNKNVYYNLAECQLADYVPSKGDWVKVKVTYQGEGQMDPVATEMEPLRRMEDDGVVSADMGDHGYINGEVFYTSAALLDGFMPRKWETVRFSAVESDQGKCKWRAVSVKASEKPQLASLKVFQGPLQKSFTQELLADKEGICITEKADFGQVTMGTSKTMTLCVKNTGCMPRKFVKCHMTASGSQIVIKDIKLFKEDTALIKGGTNDPVSGEVVLYPAMSLYVNLTLDARTGGQEKSLLIFVFDGFKIGRYIKAEVVDPMVSLVQRGVVFEKGARQGNSRYRETVDRKSAPWTVPGQRPNRNKKTVQYPHRLARYEVPADLREAALYPDDLPKFAPVLTERLSFSNYRERFKLLLHLEEIQMDVDIREFDLHRVCLRQVGEYLGLRVPGLAEGRPSVLIGDSVYLTDPGDPEGPCFEGFVHETMKDEVLLKFNPEFHRSYTGKDFNVVFTFNRGQLRKCHKATEMAETLEENVLFPSCLQPRPAISLSKSGSMHGSSSSNTGNRSALMFMNQRLNTCQRAAVNRIVQGQSRPLPYILFGPPGTGKTVTVVEAILQVFTRIPSSRIIACTPSNSAADLIAERLNGSGLLKPGDMVRLNAWQRRDETIPECILPYCRVGDDLDIAWRYRILVSTCVSLGTLYSLGIQAGHFTHIFIDEAGQATEPEAMIAACMVAQTDGQVILAGDPQQLGPVLRSHAAKEYGLGVSLLERLMCSPLYERNEKKFADHGSYDPLLVTKLVDNYRSHSAILHLPSRLFYHDELVVKADLSVTHTLIEWAELPTKGQPVIFHGVRGEDLREGNSPSWFNPGETVQVVRYLQALLNSSKVTCDDIGVITPYRKQVEKIRLLMEKLSMESVKVGSVEEFQGQERPVIIISTVRSNEDLVGFDERHTLGFLSNPKRFNVAITRAQALLVVIGNPHVLVQDEYWRQLIEYCVDQGMYRGCELPSTALGL